MNSVEGYVLRDAYSEETRKIVLFNEPVTYSYLTKAVLIRMPNPFTYSIQDSAEAFHVIEHTLISSARATCGDGLTDLGV